MELKGILDEALTLSEEILKNFELSEIPNQQIVLKCLRLARLMNDIEALDWLKQEANGFEKTKEGFMTKLAWKSAALSGRRYFEKIEDNGNETIKEYAFTETLAVLESEIELDKLRMNVAYDPNISISSQSTINPPIPRGNANERQMIIQRIKNNTEKIEKIKSNIYEYVLNVNYTLKFDGIVEDIFSRKRNIVDSSLNEISPPAIRKFISVYENLKSNNSEDWANAVHTCRRLLKDVADALYPPNDKPITLAGGKEIKVGEDQYINRLIQFIQSKSTSEKFKAVVGSHLKYIGERLDAVNEAACKGTHAEVSQDEAERYIIYTYLILGDIISLNEEMSSDSLLKEPIN